MAAPHPGGIGRKGETPLSSQWEGCIVACLFKNEFDPLKA